MGREELKNEDCGEREFQTNRKKGKVMIVIVVLSCFELHVH